ncbi:MAG: SGNH/GDSL hydrolase family protein, partial [Planctomycetota bacterium]
GHVTSNGRYSNNSYGMRGKDFDPVKPAGAFRIVAIGASTTYGVANSDQDTYPAQLERTIRENGYENVEVLNAGVTGYTTTETFINFYLTVLDLAPDMIILYQARNDVFPQAFNGYTPDSQHYRKADYSFSSTNYLHKYLFRVSHLFMWVATKRGGLFGWSERDENPHYGTVNFENRPTNSELIDNLSNDRGLNTYKKNVESIVLLARENGVKVVLSTYAFLKEKYASGIIESDEAILPVIEEQIGKANEILKRIAAERRLTLVDTAGDLAASLDDFLVDGCHFNDEGQLARAALIFEHIEQELPTKILN